MVRIRRNTLWLGLLALGCVAACDTCDDPEICDSSASLIEVNGIWTIEGEGERAGCDDSQHNGEFELGPSAKLAVEEVDVPREDSGLSHLDGMAQGDAGTDILFTDAQLDMMVSEAGDQGLETDSAIDDQGLETEGAIDDQGLDQAGSAVDQQIQDGPFDLTLLVPDNAMSVDHGTIGDGSQTESKPFFDAGPLDASSLADTKKLKPDARPRPADWNKQSFRLKGAPSNFSLSGTAQGTCVSFTTQEVTTNAGTIVYHFTGTIKQHGSGRTIEGTFTSDSLAGCMTSGDFEVTIR